MLSAKKLCQRISIAKNNAQRFASLYKPCYDLAMPNRNNWYSQGNSGEKKDQKIFDSTGIEAVRGFVNRLQASVVPPFSKWAVIKPGDLLKSAIEEETPGADQGNIDIDEIEKNLENLSDQVFAVIQASNCSQVIAESFYDLAAGTGAILISETEDIDNPVKYISIPLDSLSIDGDSDGTITFVNRSFDIDIDSLPNRYPGAKLPANCKTSSRNEIFVDECTYYDNKKKRWIHSLLYNSDIIFSSELNYNPWVIFRWQRMPGECYGRGPLIEALADLQMLNKGKELFIRGAIINVFGVYLGQDDSVLNMNAIKMEPNSIIRVRDVDKSLKRLPGAGDINAQEYMFESLRSSINRIMLNTGLPPIEGSVRSATEIIERMRQLQLDMGSSFSRIINELVAPIIKATMTLLGNKGLIDIPEGLRGQNSINAFVAKLQILSPIAKSQSIDEVQSIVEYDQILKSIDPTGQLSMLNIDDEAIGLELAEKLGVSKKVINSKKKQQEKVEQLQQIQMQQAQAQLQTQ